MTRETVVDSRQEILRTAARLFQQRGYDATSMNDVAAALSGTHDAVDYLVHDKPGREITRAVCKLVRTVSP